MGRAPTVSTSLTDIATRSMPTVSSRPVSCASRSLVPTPSVEVTSTGSCSPVGKLEHPGEAADRSQHPGDVRALHVRLDQPDGLFSRFDVHPGFPVGQIHRMLGAGRGRRRPAYRTPAPPPTGEGPLESSNRVSGGRSGRPA